MIFPDLAKDYDHSNLSYVKGPYGIRFFVAVPITTEMGMVIGQVELWDWAARDEVLVAELGFLREVAEDVLRFLETWRRAGGGGAS